MCTASALIGLPAQIIIIRHAEKPNEGNSLDLKGRERAAALVPFFLGNKEVLKHGTPVAIYATRRTTEDDSARPIETVQGIADTLDLNLNINYGHDEYPQMAKEILSTPLYDGKMVLICWEHHVIPKIAEQLKAKHVPEKWPDEVFDRLWILNYPPGEPAPTFLNLPQQLMFGDTSQ